jgi:hypothetical protein
MKNKYLAAISWTLTVSTETISRTPQSREIHLKVEYATITQLYIETEAVKIIFGNSKS